MEMGKIHSGSPKKKPYHSWGGQGVLHKDDGTEQSPGWADLFQTKEGKAFLTEGTEKVKAWNFENVTYYRSSQEFAEAGFLGANVRLVEE